MNIMYYVEKGHWDLIRCGPRFSKMELPYMALSFPTNPVQKPWFWFAHVVFDENYRTWDRARHSLGDNNFEEGIVLYALLIGLNVAGTPIVRLVSRMPSFEAMQVSAERLVI